MAKKAHTAAMIFLLIISLFSFVCAVYSFYAKNDSEVAMFSVFIGVICLWASIEFKTKAMGNKKDKEE